MRRWEYTIDQFPAVEFNRLSMDLNHRGNNGWELISLIPVVSSRHVGNIGETALDGYIAAFKREKT